MRHTWYPLLKRISTYDWTLLFSLHLRISFLMLWTCDSLYDWILFFYNDIHVYQDMRVTISHICCHKINPWTYHKRDHMKIIMTIQTSFVSTAGAVGATASNCKCEWLYWWIRVTSWPVSCISPASQTRCCVKREFAEWMSFFALTPAFSMFEQAKRVPNTESKTATLFFQPFPWRTAKGRRDSLVDSGSWVHWRFCCYCWWWCVQPLLLTAWDVVVDRLAEWTLHGSSWWLHTSSSRQLSPRLRQLRRLLLLLDILPDVYDQDNGSRLSRAVRHWHASRFHWQQTHSTCVLWIRQQRSSAEAVT